MVVRVTVNAEILGCSSSGQGYLAYIQKIRGFKSLTAHYQAQLGDYKSLCATCMRKEGVAARYYFQKIRF